MFAILAPAVLALGAGCVVGGQGVECRVRRACDQRRLQPTSQVDDYGTPRVEAVSNAMPAGQELLSW